MALKDISCRFGGLLSDGTGATAVIMSRVAGDVTLNINGTGYTVSMSVCGNDRAELDDAGVQYAGYYGVQVITGLTPFTVYEWTVTQGSSTDSGYFRTAPNTKKSKFSIAFGTCFAPNNTDEYQTSAWRFLRHYIDNTDYPMLACMWSDDIFYADGYFGANGLYVNSQGKRFETNNGDLGTRSQYDYALNYMSWFGLLTTFYNESAPTAQYVKAGLSNDAQYCLARMAFMPQYGDHEFSNNIGWNGGRALTTLPNGMHKTVAGDFLGNGYVVYSQLMAPLQGIAVKDEVGANDTSANHWYVDFGPLRYLSFDPICNAVYNADPALCVTYGTNQINDMLNIAANGNQWFTCIANPAVSGRGTPTYDAAEIYYGYKNENYASGEYELLWRATGNTPPSLMDSDRTNGNLGCCFMVRGDWHEPVNLYWYAPADVGLAAESFMEIGLATVNSSTGTTQDLRGDTSLFAVDNVELLGSITRGTEVANKLDRFTMTIAEIDGTKATPEMVIKQWEIEYNNYDDVPASQAEHFTKTDNIERATDTDGNVWRVVMSKRLVLYAGNQGYDLEEIPWQIPQTSAGVK